MEMEGGIRSAGAMEHSDVVPGYCEVNAGEEARHTGLEGSQKSETYLFICVRGAGFHGIRDLLGCHELSKGRDLKRCYQHKFTGDVQTSLSHHSALDSDWLVSSRTVNKSQVLSIILLTLLFLLYTLSHT